MTKHRRWPARLLGWSFALVAMAASAAFASTLTEDPAIKAGLVVLSVLAVLFERCAITWGRRARERQDKAAVGMAYALLGVAVIYTAGMQLGFFGHLMLNPVAAERGQAADVAAIDQRIANLEERRGWIPKPPGTPEALEAQIEAMKRDARTAEDREKVNQLRAHLASARSLEAIEDELSRLRKERAALVARPPADAKAHVLANIAPGLPPEWIATGTVIIAVLLLQMGQIFLPTLAGGPVVQARGAPEERPLKTAPAAPPAPAAKAPKSAPKVRSAAKISNPPLKVIPGRSSLAEKLAAA